MFSNMYFYILFVQIIGELYLSVYLSVYNLLFTTEILYCYCYYYLLNYLNETFFIKKITIKIYKKYYFNYLSLLTNHLKKWQQQYQDY